MSIKDIWSKTSKWVLKRHDTGSEFNPAVGDDGLISPQDEPDKEKPVEEPASSDPVQEHEPEPADTETKPKAANADLAELTETTEPAELIPESEPIDSAEELPEPKHSPEQSHEDVETSPAEAVENHAVVKHAQQMDKHQTLEKLQQGFNTLIEQLRGVNEHLELQAHRNEDLMKKFEQVPDLLEKFPQIIESNKKLVEKFYEQVKTGTAKEALLLDAVDKIPAETAKQTDALAEINHQLAAAADTDVQMAEDFNKFNETMAKLNESTGSQTESIMQMSKTFSTSDRYMKYIISKQNRRFMWVFFIAMGICVTVILIMTGIIIYLKSR
ncbi:MAG: hypothetical protein ACYTBP_15425 [Planctomycetota bacterium]|jgi:chromosome segregation ATPase